MALVNETGVGLATAESFCSVADADTYFTAHGSPAEWSAATVTTALKEAALRFATRWLNARYAWPGSVLLTTQRLSWPRSGASDSDGRDLDTWSVVKDLYLLPATCEVALEHLKLAINEVLARGGDISSVQIDTLAVQWFATASATREFSYVDLLLSPVVSPELAVFVRTVRG